ncbi:hypothetical protein [uncultured Microbulbifer sp.]|uniref:hypothetical protein n=1 Tax=uncultured Microbulbifer sp. TaxID=348147 RepID=UPI00262B1071|nr:hypothetical protein [uncultured Microbulbifer sp.]
MAELGLKAAWARLANWWSPKKPIEERTLWQIGLFKTAFFIPLLLAIISASWIAARLDLPMEPTYVGLNRLFDIYKFPIALFSLALPFTAFIATNHRSAQSAESLKRAELQNSFSNYFTHRKEFFDLLSQLETELKITFSDTGALYQNCFPRNKKSDFNIDPAGLNEYTAQPYLLHLDEEFESVEMKIAYPEVPFTQEKVIEIYGTYSALSDQLFFQVKDGVEINNGAKIGFSNEDPLTHRRLISKVLIQLGRFSDIDCFNARKTHHCTDFDTAARIYFKPENNYHSQESKPIDTPVEG